MAHVNVIYKDKPREEENDNFSAKKSDLGFPEIDNHENVLDYSLDNLPSTKGTLKNESGVGYIWDEYTETDKWYLC